MVQEFSPPKTNDFIVFLNSLITLPQISLLILTCTRGWIYLLELLPLNKPHQACSHIYYILFSCLILLTKLWGTGTAFGSTMLYNKIIIKTKMQLKNYSKIISKYIIQTTTTLRALMWSKTLWQLIKAYHRSWLHY